MGERQVVSVEHQGDQYTTRWDDGTSEQTAGDLERSTRRAGAGGPAVGSGVGCPACHLDPPAMRTPRRDRRPERPPASERPQGAPTPDDESFNCWHCWTHGGQWEWNSELGASYWLWRPCTFCAGTGRVYFREAVERETAPGRSGETRQGP